MNSYKSFVKRLLLKRWVANVFILLLLLVANYMTFIGIRSGLSTVQGYLEMKNLEQEGTYIANLDPECDLDYSAITEPDVRTVFHYLSSKFSYALYTDGYVISLPDCDMDISLNYFNQGYYELFPFSLSRGTTPNFDYRMGEQEIPVLVGAGLAQAYPLNSTIQIIDPVVEHPVSLKVVGILKTNAFHSNVYSLNWKIYYNYSIMLPVNEAFLKEANVDFHVNAITNMIVTQSTEQKVSGLSDEILQRLGMKLNFFSQQENNDEFRNYYLSSLVIQFVFALLLTAMAASIAIWHMMKHLRSLLKNSLTDTPETICLAQEKRGLCSYWGVISLVDLLSIVAITSFERYGYWSRGDTLVAAYGFLGLIGIDWGALLAVVLTDILLGKIIIKIVGNNIEKQCAGIHIQ